MKQEKNTGVHLVFMIISFACMLLFLAIFWCNIPQMSVPQNQQVYTSCENPNPTAPRMSKTDIVDRMDNMQKAINRIDNQYLQNIDTMVNKMNTWTGYWLTLLTFILMIVSIWQFINVKNIREGYNEMKKQTSDTMKGIDDKKIVVDNKIKQYNSIVQILSSINAINSLSGSRLIHISSISDIKYCLEKLSMSLMDIERYIQEKEPEGKTQIGEEINLDIVKLLPIILINVRGALYQAKAYSENILDNIIFDNLQDQLSDLEYNIRHNSVISNADKHSLHCITMTISELKESL